MSDNPISWENVTNLQFRIDLFLFFLQKDVKKDDDDDSPPLDITLSG